MILAGGDVVDQPGRIALDRLRRVVEGAGKFRAGGRKAIWESARLAREEGGVNFSIRADETSRL